MGLLSRVAKASVRPPAEKKASGGLLSRVGLGGAAMLSAPGAYGEDAPDDAALMETQSRIAKLQSDLDVFDTGTPIEIQELLLRRGRPVKVDGKIGPDTAAAISEDKAVTLAELDKERARLSQLETQAAFRSTEASPEQEMLREFGPWAATGLGLVAGYGSRGGAVKKAGKEAAKKMAAANAYLTPGAVTKGKGVAGFADMMARPANLNEFWRMGGAGEDVPFKLTSGGEWRPKAKSASMSSLYPEPSKNFRTSDYGMVGSGLGEAGVSAGAYVAAEAELKAAQTAADQEPTEANLARLERARDMVKIAESAARLGLGFAAGRAGAAVKMPYASARPNIAGAEAEKALVLDYLRRTRTPPGTP